MPTERVVLQLPCHRHVDGVAVECVHHAEHDVALFRLALQVVRVADQLVLHRRAVCGVVLAAMSEECAELVDELLILTFASFPLCEHTGLRAQQVGRKTHVVHLVASVQHLQVQLGEPITVLN